MVIITNSSMIPAHNKVRASKVFAHNRMVDSLFWTSIPHFCVQRYKHGSLLLIVVVNQGLICTQNNLVFKVTFLFLADKRVDKKAIKEVKCSLLQHLMSNMGNVSCLEPDNCLPAVILDLGPRFRRSFSMLAQLRIRQPLNNINPAAD